ncbi:hypothetical protein Poli38472_012559 [Pythium oligandrum]|uniref:FYVE-type domain-containing protein n=1 Tax=Pythium oligandrum TaxID=41045 RepID=A0A8K1CE65_PYTOL|nr:hypothetical protein Poli38472_012559 [Pythium oligandrum]|eukprot:TMW61368.1 hypothetical protein Poli38472_012559 [Pythium oligandrum]
MKDPRVPMLVAAGKVEGKLEDIVFGSLNCDEASWRLRSTYMKDKLADARILSTILGPTEEDPYRFLSVKWFMRERKKSVITPLVYNRDFLVIEATGLTVDEYGVPHGYYLLHTFKHPSLPELTDLKIVRCNISLCYISRQISANRVQIFGRGFVDPGGDLLQGISDALAAEAMLSTANVAETSYAKKLMWLITQERSTNAQQRHQHAQSMAAKRCEACKKHVRFLSGSLSFCQVCGKCVCSKCTIPRKLVVDISMGGITERVLPFCFACVLEAKETPPRQVAIDTVVRSQAS